MWSKIPIFSNVWLKLFQNLNSKFFKNFTEHSKIWGQKFKFFTKLFAQTFSKIGLYWTFTILWSKNPIFHRDFWQKLNGERFRALTLKRWHNYSEVSHGYWLYVTKMCLEKLLKYFCKDFNCQTLTFCNNAVSFNWVQTSARSCKIIR